MKEIGIQKSLLGKSKCKDNEIKKNKTDGFNKRLAFLKNLEVLECFQQQLFIQNQIMGISVSMPSQSYMQNKSIFYQAIQVQQNFQKHDQNKSMEKEIINNPNGCSKQNVIVQNSHNSTCIALKQRNMKKEEISKSFNVSIQNRQEQIENQKANKIQTDQSSLCNTPRIKANMKLTPLRS